MLLLDSFFFSVISGERSCQRAWTETMIASGLLGTGSLGVFAGLAWVIHNARRGDREPLRMVLITAHVIAAIILLHLYVTTEFYLRDMYAPKPAPMALLAITKVTAGVMVGLLISASLLRRRMKSDKRAVRRAAYCALGYGIVCSVAFAVFGGRPQEQWEPTPVWITVTAVLLALTVAGISATALIAALPGESPADAGGKGKPPAARATTGAQQGRPEGAAAPAGPVG